MKISPISNDQQSFNGYVHKNFKTYINKVVKNECERIVNNANENAEKIDPSLLEAVYKKGQTVISKLQKFIGPMHKNTNINTQNSYMELSNPVAYYRISIVPMLIENIHWSRPTRNIYTNAVQNDYASKIRKLRYSALDDIEQIIDDLIKNIKPEDVDNKFLQLAEETLIGRVSENGTGLIGRIKSKLEVRRIEKYAKSIGKATNARQSAEKRIKNLKEREKLEARNEQKIKEIERSNKKIMDDILNKK